MFEEQNKVEDILADADNAAPTSVPPTASAPLGAIAPPPPGPPSALAGGKLQPVRPGAEPSLPSSQLSDAARAAFPLKKMLAMVVASAVVVGSGVGAFFWWRARNAPAFPAPTSGAPAAKENATQPAETNAPSLPSTPAPDPNQTDGGALGNTYQEINQGAINKALDPFAESARDTDEDGLSDSEETDFGTNPRLVDSDSDGLSDVEEIKIFGTNPLQPDTDGDRYLDGEEVQNGYNPKGPGKLLDFEKAKEGIQ